MGHISHCDNVVSAAACNLGHPPHCKREEYTGLILTHLFPMIFLKPEERAHVHRSNTFVQGGRMDPPVGVFMSIQTALADGVAVQASGTLRAR